MQCNIPLKPLLIQQRFDGAAGLAEVHLAGITLLQRRHDFAHIFDACSADFLDRGRNGVLRRMFVCRILDSILVRIAVNTPSGQRRKLVCCPDPTVAHSGHR